MKFKDYYLGIEDSHKKRLLRNTIIKACKVQLPSFYSWLRKEKFPPLVREKISLILKKSEFELFPEITKKEEEKWSI